MCYWLHALKTDEKFFLRYDITTEPIEDRQFKRLPDHVKDTVQGLRDKAQSHPWRAIHKLNALIKKYPKLPMLYNYLSVAYSRVGQIEKAEKYYDILKEIASDYPMTKILRQKLHPGFLRRLLNRMVNQRGGA